MLEIIKFILEFTFSSICNFIGIVILFSLLIDLVKAIRKGD